MSDLNKFTKAIKPGDVDQVRAILDEDSGLVRERDEAGATVLHYATLQELREIVQLLLDRGAASYKTLLMPLSLEMLGR